VGGLGAYRPTELGKAFGHAHDFDNGCGGFAHRQWGWLSWAHGALDALQASMEAYPSGVATSAARTEAVATSLTGSDASGQFRHPGGWIVAVVP
jgi:hypothetical protein